MHPKYLLICRADDPLKGYFVYGKVYNHADLAEDFEKRCGYCRVHGGGWYWKDDEKKEIILYGCSGDYGQADFNFLNCIPAKLRGYTFIYTPILKLPGNPLDLSEVEWV